MVASIIGTLIGQWMDRKFRYSLIVGGVQTGRTAWRFCFDYANAMDVPVILEKAILRFTFENEEGAWTPVAFTTRFTQNRHFGAKEKRDPQENGYMSVRVCSEDIEFPEESAHLKQEPGIVHDILSMTKKAEISLRVRVGNQVHQTQWYEYGDYGPAHSKRLTNQARQHFLRSKAGRIQVDDSAFNENQEGGSI
jgi:hypothetical protein